VVPPSAAVLTLDDRAHHRPSSYRKSCSQPPGDRRLAGSCWRHVLQRRKLSLPYRNSRKVRQVGIVSSAATTAFRRRQWWSQSRRGESAVEQHERFDGAHVGIAVGCNLAGLVCDTRRPPVVRVGVRSRNVMSIGIGDLEYNCAVALIGVVSVKCSRIARHRDTCRERLITAGASVTVRGHRPFGIDSSF